MKRALIALGTMATIAFTATVADAKTMYKFRSGPWNASAHTNNKTGAFSHCAASAKYKSGITLVFSVNRNYKWKMSFAKPSWRLNSGNSYPIVYRVDRNRIFKSRATAINSKMAMTPLPGKNLFNQMRRGRKLYVKTKKDTLGFSLNGSSKMLASLVRCVKKNNVRATDPFGDAGSDPFGDASSSSDPFGEGRPARKRRKPRSNNFDDTI